MKNKILLYIQLVPKLGYWNILYMLWYRLSLKFGLRKQKFSLGIPINGTFFFPAKTDFAIHYPEQWKQRLQQKAESIISGHLIWFHYHSFKVDNPPNWFKNPFNGSILKNPNKHWTELSDFDLNTGDIKIIWEPSRFDWLTDLARAYSVFKDDRYLDTINMWIKDWSAKNPKNQGPNWKCGQEASIRIMKLITSAYVLGQYTNASKSLCQLIYDHLERISGNINYAIAQDNNHGTSEAAGLYIGATWLLKQNNFENNNKILISWKKKGRKILENRILKLIAPQGTFSQRSVNYHRVVMDTMSWVNFNIELLNEPKFKLEINHRLQKLGEWQFKFIASPKGEVPNIGSNDGAMLETLHNCDYRDFRPSTQLFFGTLCKQRLFQEGCHDEAIFWRYPKEYFHFPLKKFKNTMAEILDEQFLIISLNHTKLFMKIPKSNFRPTASDAFHIDLWHNDKNLLCDSGSYSYNADKETDWFKSVEAHNTIQFGCNQQMPKISRFLFSNWLNAHEVKPLKIDKNISWAGKYKDYNGNEHYRSVCWEIDTNRIVVEDKLLMNTNDFAKLRWHSEFNLSELNNIKVLTNNSKTIKPKSEITGNSLYYMNKKNKNTYLYIEKSVDFKTIIEL